MQQIKKIIASSAYREYLEKNKKAEENRIFCTHHFEHLLSTARLTYILILEEGTPFISREMVYAAGLTAWPVPVFSARHVKNAPSLFINQIGIQLDIKCTG